MMKKVISFITALSIIGTMSFATYAYDEPVQPVAPASSYGVMPLYDNVKLCCIRNRYQRKQQSNLYRFIFPLLHKKISYYNDTYEIN